MTYEICTGVAVLGGYVNVCRRLLALGTYYFSFRIPKFGWEVVFF